MHTVLTDKVLRPSRYAMAGDGEPLATFIFRYRSRRDLVKAGIIPRGDEVDEMTNEELLTAFKALRRRVWAANGVKSEAFSHQYRGNMSVEEMRKRYRALRDQLADEVEEKPGSGTKIKRGGDDEQDSTPQKRVKREMGVVDLTQG